MIGKQIIIEDVPDFYVKVFVFDLSKQGDVEKLNKTLHKYTLHRAIEKYVVGDKLLAYCEIEIPRKRKNPFVEKKITPAEVPQAPKEDTPVFEETKDTKINKLLSETKQDLLEVSHEKTKNT